MQKKILALALCALIPALSIAVAQADVDENVEEVSETEDEDLYEDESVQESEDVVAMENLESRAVVKRVTCVDIKKEMDALNAIAELDDEQLENLSMLKAEYRSRCTQKSASRRSGARAKVSVDKSAEVNSTCDTPDANGCCPGEIYKDLGGSLGFNCCTKNNEHCFPPIKTNTPKCEDGSNPDLHGCCAGETYKNLGDLGYNCCLSDGITCFPPLTK